MTFVLINQKIANCKKNFTIWHEPTYLKEETIKNAMMSLKKRYLGGKTVRKGVPLVFLFFFLLWDHPYITSIFLDFF